MAAVIPEYRITDVKFSLTTRVESQGERTDDHIVGSVPYDRVTTLQAHVTYQYIGVTTQEEYGTVVVDLADVSTVSFDKDGIATSISHEEVPDSSSILGLIRSTVSDDLSSRKVVEAERTWNRGVLATINKDFEQYLADSALDDYSPRFTPQFEGYEELQDWNTGIGAVGYNEYPASK